MLKPLLVGSCLALCVFACSTVPPAHQKFRFTADRMTDPFCVRETGTRIRRAAGECLPVPGRRYSREMFEATGAFTVSDALQMLDPAVTTTR
jgi:hypothetical protein